METSPANLILHYWHFDEDFCESLGVAAALPMEGDISFTELARRYAGDIPVGALKEVLRRAGVISEDNGILTVRKRYFQPQEFDEDFIRNIALSIKNIARTVVHNANLVSRSDFTQALGEELGRFERFAWSDELRGADRLGFRGWVRSEGAKFIEEADHWIGKHETHNQNARPNEARTIGVGIYFFEED